MKAYQKKKKEIYASLESIWKAVRQVQNQTSRQSYLLNILRSDECYITDPEKKIEELKNVLLPVLYSAELLNLVNFEHPNDLAIP